jgi:general secretion pathway protein I
MSPGAGGREFAQGAGRRRRAPGFTLIEVLVALGIVAIALLAGLKATTALTTNAMRQSDVLLAHLCAENELVRVRLSRRMPTVGEATVECDQAGRRFSVNVNVLPTPNPSFRRVDAQVLDGSSPVLRLSTIVGRY